MGLFSSKSKPVNKVIAALKAIFIELDSQGIDKQICDHIYETITTSIHDRPRLLDKMKSKRKSSPFETALKFTHNVSGHLLQTGEHHLSRGVLSPQKGEHLWKIFDYTLVAALDNGICTEDKASKLRSEMLERIQQVGYLRPNHQPAIESNGLDTLGPMGLQPRLHNLLG